MRPEERKRGLLRVPGLVWDVMFRGRYSFIYDQMPMRMNGMSWAKRWNLVRSGGNLIHRRLSPWSMPLHMQVELTNRCNLQCPVCPTGTGAIERPAKAMDVGLFERLMEEVGPYLLTMSLWAWGEPLLHAHLKDILRIARRYDVNVLLSTNGQMLSSDRVIDALSSEPPTYLIVAIDGLTDETNSRYRVGAKLQPALDGVRRLAEIKRESRSQAPVLQMRYIIMKHNQHELEEAPNFARRHEFDLLTIRTLSIIDAESPDRVHQNLIPDDQLWRAYDYDSGKRVERSDYICQEPFWFPTVFADGTLVPCEQDFNAQLAMGKITENVSFRDLWYSERAAEVRRKVRDEGDELSFCQNCPYADRDVTDCSIEAHFLNREIDYPNLVWRAGAQGQ